MTVDEDAIAQAMVLLAERAKMVVESARAAGGALLTGAVAPAARGTTVALLSCGNVDAGVLSPVAHRAETNGGRRLRLFTRVDGRPGGLASLLQAMADAGVNVLDVEHVRDGVALHVREAGLELTREMRGREHAETICSVLTAGGFGVVPELPSTSLVSRA